MAPNSRFLMALIGAVGLVLFPQASWSEIERCEGEAAGYASIHFSESSPLIRVDQPFWVTATLCADGTAVGGGIASLTVANDDALPMGSVLPVSPDSPLDLLEPGTEMEFDFLPTQWESSPDWHPRVIADLVPTGAFRQLLLDALGGDEAALEAWAADVTAPLPGGGHDLDGDSEIDLRVTAWLE